MTQEQPVFFAAGEDTLFGILAQPDPLPDERVAVINMMEAVAGGMRIKNGVQVRLARAIARAGLTSFRFDFHGMGESTGLPPYVSRLGGEFVPDLAGAIDWLRPRGYERFILVGSCLGAETALLGASVRTDIEALVLLSCRFAIHHTQPEITAERMLSAARSICDRRIPTLFCYGRDDRVLIEFDAAGRVGLTDAMNNGRTTVAHFPGAIHSFHDVELQPDVIDVILDWLRGVTSPIRLPGEHRAEA